MAGLKSGLSNHRADRLTQLAAEFMPTLPMAMYTSRGAVPIEEAVGSSGFLQSTVCKTEINACVPAIEGTKTTTKGARHRLFVFKVDGLAGLVSPPCLFWVPVDVKGMTNAWYLRFSDANLAVTFNSR